MIFPDEIWNNILDYIVWQTPKNAKKVLEKHAILPYAFSLHEFKGLQNNLDFHKRYNPWIFNIMLLMLMGSVISP